MAVCCSLHLLVREERGWKQGDRDLFLRLRRLSWGKNDIEGFVGMRDREEPAGAVRDGVEDADGQCWAALGEAAQEGAFRVDQGDVTRGSDVATIEPAGVAEELSDSRSRRVVDECGGRGDADELTGDHDSDAITPAL